MNLLLTLAHTLVLLFLPFLLIGLINRCKSWWGGRRGPGLLQSFWDLRRLLFKQSVYSTSSTALFRVAAWLVLLCHLMAGLIAPLVGGSSPLQFSFDFVVFAYLLGLGRIALMLSALDVGSAFEGMGAAREASFSAFVEPAFFLLIGALGLATGQTSFGAMLAALHHSPAFGLMLLPCLLTLFILLQTEAARVPVDDPSTHLELTMVHEVMVLDHSGPELAAMQYAAALKLTVYASLIAVLLNPLDASAHPIAAGLASLVLMLGVAVAVGCVESLMARRRLRRVPHYLLLAGGAALASLALAAWIGGAP